MIALVVTLSSLVAGLIGVSAYAVYELVRVRKAYDELQKRRQDDATQIFLAWGQSNARVLKSMEARMSKLDDLTQALDTETTAVATRIDSILTELGAAQAASQAPAQATLDRLAAISERLKALGTNPSDPIPAAPTDPSGVATAATADGSKAPAVDPGSVSPPAVK